MAYAGVNPAASYMILARARTGAHSGGVCSFSPVRARKVRKAVDGLGDEEVCGIVACRKLLIRRSRT